MTNPSSEDVAWYGTKSRAIAALKQRDQDMDDLRYNDWVEKNQYFDAHKILSPVVWCRSFLKCHSRPPNYVIRLTPTKAYCKKCYLDL